MNTFRQRGYPLGVPSPKGNEPGLYITYVGLFESSGDFLWENLSQTYCLHVIRRGAGVFAVDGMKYEARADSVFMFHPGMHITYYDSAQSPWWYTWLHFAGGDTEWAFDAIGLGRGTPYRDVQGNATFRQAVDTFSQSVQRGQVSSLAPVSAAWQVLDALSAPTSRSTSETQSLAEACRLVLENQLERTPSVEDLAARFGVNRTTLFRAFKDQFRMSPKEYIDLLRFEKAQSLLRCTNQTVKQIALSCGFRSQDYFSAAFRKRHGMPPSVWREKG